MTESDVISIWQVDSFEGGKGSRADFLKRTGEEFTKQSGGYVTVTSLTSEAVRMNFKNGVFPDLISYGPGTYGIEEYIDGYTSWCNGGYCFIAVDETADFTDIENNNTLINEGKENFAGLAALFGGVGGAVSAKPTAAYLKLINGDYKYLLGTQRDIYRFKTRAVSYKVKPLTEYNDLYQNISVISKSAKKNTAKRFISLLTARQTEIKKIGLFSPNVKLYDDDLNIMEGLEYQHKLSFPLGTATFSEFKKLIAEGDVNKLKNLLK